MITKLLKKVVPTPLRPPIYRAVLSLWLYVRLRGWRRGRRPLETSKQIHLINPLGDYTGGPLRTLNLFRELKKHCKVSLWTEYDAAPEIVEKYPVKRIVAERFEFPQTGTLVFVGTYFPIGSWIHYTYPRRIILVHNADIALKEFRRKLRQLSNKGRRKVEVVYASESTKMSVDHPGFVQTSLIDIDRFAPYASKPSDSASANFTVGRLSRAAPSKHHPDDSALYRLLGEHGCHVKIMGAPHSFEAELGSLESVTLLPMFAQEPHMFLQGLDCFFYRTSEEYFEPSGRVVTEAMASGLPVVCHERGGYVDIIDHGHNGFLFNTQQEALEILLRLKEDRALRESVGKMARESAEELFSSASRSEIVAFYLR